MATKRKRYPKKEKKQEAPKHFVLEVQDSVAGQATIFKKEE
jgi:hypothetical protein